MLEDTRFASAVSGLGDMAPGVGGGEGAEGVDARFRDLRKKFIRCLCYKNELLGIKSRRLRDVNLYEVKLWGSCSRFMFLRRSSSLSDFQHEVLVGLSCGQRRDLKSPRTKMEIMMLDSL